MSDSPGLFRPRNFLIAALVGVGLIVLVLSTSVDAKRAAELRAGELAGVGARLVGGAAAAPRLRATLATKDLLPRAKLRVEMRPRRMIPGHLGFCPACREA